MLKLNVPDIHDCHQEREVVNQLWKLLKTVSLRLEKRVFCHV
jgi:hypothetical protein